MGGEQIFLLGATGYIGGSILTALLALPSPPSLITCLVRDPRKAELLENISTPEGVKVKALIGSLAEKGNKASITETAENSDVVVNAATSDEVDWLRPVFEGIRRRKEKNGVETVFIHTSGTGMFHDDARGMYAAGKVSQRYPRPCFGVSHFR